MSRRRGVGPLAGEIALPFDDDVSGATDSTGHVAAEQVSTEGSIPASAPVEGDDSARPVRVGGWDRPAASAETDRSQAGTARTLGGRRSPGGARARSGVAESGSAASGGSVADAAGACLSYAECGGSSGRTDVMPAVVTAAHARAAELAREPFSAELVSEIRDLIGPVPRCRR